MSLVFPRRGAVLLITCLAAPAFAAPAIDLRAVLEERRTRDGAPEVRVAAARHLALVGDAAAREDLIEVLAGSADSLAVEDAARTLADLGGAAHRDLLLRVLAEGASPSIRGSAGAAAYRLAPGRTLELAASRLGSAGEADDRSLARRVARALEAAPVGGAEPFLEAAFRAHGSDTFAGPALLDAWGAAPAAGVFDAVDAAFAAGDDATQDALAEFLLERDEPWVGGLALRWLGGTGSVAARVAAAQVAARETHGEFSPAALPLFEDPATPPELGAVLALLLGVEGHAAATPALALALREGAGPVRVGAARGLGHLGAHREELAEILLDSTEALDVREACAVALGDVGDPLAVAPLAEVLRVSGPREVLRAAARSLARLGGDDALGALRAALQGDAGEPSQEAVARVPGSLDVLIDEVAEAAQAPDFPARDEALIALGERPGPRRRAHLLRFWDEGGPGGDLAFFMLAASEAWAPSLTFRMIPVLRGGAGRFEKFLAAISLGYAGDAAAAHALAAAAQYEQDEEIRLMALASIPRDHAEDLREAAAHVLARDDVALNRLFAAAYLTRVAAHDDAPVLVRAARRDPDPRTRRLAVHALGRFVSGQVAEVLGGLPELPRRPTMVP